MTRMSLLASALAFCSVPAFAAPPLMQVASSNFDLTVAPPGAPAATGPLYEKAPMPNENTLAPAYASAGAGDPLQPSVISRSSTVGQSDGYSHSSSQQSATDARMKPGLGFALHLPTE